MKEKEKPTEWEDNPPSTGVQEDIPCFPPYSGTPLTSLGIDGTLVPEQMGPEFLLVSGEHRNNMNLPDLHNPRTLSLLWAPRLLRLRKVPVVHGTSGRSGEFDQGSETLRGSTRSDYSLDPPHPTSPPISPVSGDFGVQTGVGVIGMFLLTNPKCIPETPVPPNRTSSPGSSSFTTPHNRSLVRTKSG